MILFNKKTALTLVAVIAAFSVQVFAQAKPGDGSPSQRLEVMKQRLETIRRSAASAACVLKEEGEEDKKKESVDTPIARLRSIEKEASTLQSDVNSIRGKVDRSEKYEASEIDQLEAAVAELQTRAEAVQVETAQARASDVSPEGKPRE